MDTVSSGQDILDRTTAIKNDGGDLTYQKNKSLITGALIGAAGGAYFGYAKKQNMLVLALLGSVVGAIIAGAFLPK